MPPTAGAARATCRRLRRRRRRRLWWPRTAWTAPRSRLLAAPSCHPPPRQFSRRCGALTCQRCAGSPARIRGSPAGCSGCTTCRCSCAAMGSRARTSGGWPSSPSGSSRCAPPRRRSPSGAITTSACSRRATTTRSPWRCGARPRTRRRTGGCSRGMWTTRSSSRAPPTGSCTCSTRARGCCMRCRLTCGRAHPPPPPPPPGVLRAHLVASGPTSTRPTTPTPTPRPPAALRRCSTWRGEGPRACHRSSCCSAPMHACAACASRRRRARQCMGSVRRRQ